MPFQVINESKFEPGNSQAVPAALTFPGTQRLRHLGFENFLRRTLIRVFRNSDLKQLFDRCTSALICVPVVVVQAPRRAVIFAIPELQQPLEPLSFCSLPHITYIST